MSKSLLTTLAIVFGGIVVLYLLINKSSGATVYDSSPALGSTSSLASTISGISGSVSALTQISDNLGFDTSDDTDDDDDD